MIAPLRFVQKVFIQIVSSNMFKIMDYDNCMISNTTEIGKSKVTIDLTRFKRAKLINQDEMIKCLSGIRIKENRLLFNFYTAM